MTTHLITRKNAKLELNGNELTGDTYAIKDIIRIKLNGKWNADRKSWTVDTDLLDKYLKGNSIGLRINTAPMTTTSKSNGNGICPRCHTYCYGDCTAN